MWVESFQHSFSRGMDKPYRQGVGVGTESPHISFRMGLQYIIYLWNIKIPFLSLVLMYQGELHSDLMTLL